MLTVLDVTDTLTVSRHIPLGLVCCASVIMYTSHQCGFTCECLRGCPPARALLLLRLVR